MLELAYLYLGFRVVQFVKLLLLLGLACVVERPQLLVKLVDSVLVFALLLPDLLLELGSLQS